jgi:hypothetical protein
MPLSQGSGCTHDVHEVTIPNVGFMLVHSWATCFSKFTWVFTLCSLEAKHSVKGIAEMTLKLTNDLHGALQLCVTSSHTRECTHWGWTYRSAFSRICYGLTLHADLLTGFPGCFWKCYRNVGHRCLYNCLE